MNSRITTVGLLVLLFVLFAGVSPDARAQQGDVVASIERALNRGNVSALLSHGSDRIAVAVLGEAREYSQAQAEYVLKDFFKTHKVVSFKFTDSSETQNGIFAEGRLRYRGATSPLRVFVRMRMNGSNWELREIIIRK